MPLYSEPHHWLLERLREQVERYKKKNTQPYLMWNKSRETYTLTVRWWGYKPNAPGGALYQYQYSMLNQHNNREIILNGANWADFDQQGRIVLARGGKLFKAALKDNELIYVELSDFNANKPEPMEAPEWAKK